MAHSLEGRRLRKPKPAAFDDAAGLPSRILAKINGLIVIVSSVALVIAALVLTYGVVTRYFLHFSTDWQDEMSVFLIVGAVFMSSAAVQARRGHVAIEAVSALLSDHVNRCRLFPGRRRDVRFLRLFRVEIGAVAGRGDRRKLPFELDLAAAAVDSLFADDGRHDAVEHSGAVSNRRPVAPPEQSGMSVLTIGLLYGAATLLVMFAGMPIAFALGAVATIFMVMFMPSASVDTITQNVYEEMASITLLSIPLFILKGAAIGRSRAGQDLYGALHAWLHKIPGGLGIANVFACALFAAMAGSSPATCSAIGSAGIPEMRKRGYSGGFAAGIIAAGGTLGILLPPSITMILYAVAAEQSLGRLFLAAIGPALLLVVLFAGYAMWRFQWEFRRAKGNYEKTGVNSELLRIDTMSVRDKFALLPRVLPFVLLLTGVMIALYGGFATPSETAGLGAILALALIAVIYSVWTPHDLEPILVSTLRESTMLMLIIGMSLLYSYVMSYLHISQSTAEWIVSLHLSRWVLLDDFAHGCRARLLSAAGVDHPDDRADHPAAAARRGFRSHLVRRGHDHRDGDGLDSSAGRPQYFRDQEYRAGHSP